MESAATKKARVDSSAPSDVGLNTLGLVADKYLPRPLELLALSFLLVTQCAELRELSKSMRSLVHEAFAQRRHMMCLEQAEFRMLRHCRQLQTLRLPWRVWWYQPSVVPMVLRAIEANCETLEGFTSEEGIPTAVVEALAACPRLATFEGAANLLRSLTEAKGAQYAEPFVQAL